MKLTKSDRQAFVLSVMDDVPSIDYSELCRSRCVAWAIDRMPKEVKVVYKKHPDYFVTNYMHTPGGLCNPYVPMPDVEHSTKSNHPELWAELQILADADRDQDEKRGALKAKVTASIAARSTLKQAKERLPEFEKYLPADRDGTGTINLPATTNLVADLMQAGWPKEAQA